MECRNVRRQKTLLANEALEKAEGSQIFDTSVKLRKKSISLYPSSSLLRSPGLVTHSNIRHEFRSDKEPLLLCIAPREPRYVTGLRAGIVPLLTSWPVTHVRVPSFLLSCRKVSELRQIELLRVYRPAKLFEDRVKVFISLRREFSPSFLMIDAKTRTMSRESCASSQISPPARNNPPRSCFKCGRSMRSPRV